MGTQAAKGCSYNISRYPKTALLFLLLDCNTDKKLSVSIMKFRETESRINGLFPLPDGNFSVRVIIRSPITLTSRLIRVFIFSGGHGFDSFWGLRFFPCPTFVLC